MKKKLDDFIEIYDDSVPEDLIDLFVEFFEDIFLKHKPFLLSLGQG